MYFSKAPRASEDWNWMVLYSFLLRLHIRLIEEEDNYFLIRTTPHIDPAVHLRLGRIPICQSRMHLKGLDLFRVTVFDLQRLAAHDDCKPVTQVRMPGQSFARL